MVNMTLGQAVDAAMKGHVILRKGDSGCFKIDNGQWFRKAIHPAFQWRLSVGPRPVPGEWSV